MSERNTQAEAKDFVPVMFRLPKDLHKRVKAIAAKGRRSLNSEAIVLLEKALDQAEAEPELTS